MKPSAIKRVASFLLVLMSSITHAGPVLTNIQGDHIPFSSLKGKWVFINYWASWCNTCLNEIPEFNKFYQAHKDSKQVALYAVNYDVLPAKDQLELIQKYNISYPSLLKDPAQTLKLGDITGVPVTFIFNPEGKHVKTLYGGQSAKTLGLAMS